MFKREYTLKLSKETDEALSGIAARSGMTRSEALSRALDLLRMADRARMRDPRRTFAIVTDDGESVKVNQVIEGIFNAKR